MTVHNNYAEPWKVTLVDTGLNTMTGGRVKRIQEYVGDEPFMLTYGDGVSDVDITALVDFHKKHGKIATMTAIQPDGRFGVLDIESNQINAFREKNREDSGWINAGFMVLNKEIFDVIQGDKTIFEQGPLEIMSTNGELMAYKHHNFWQCMDTQRDKQKLEELWNTGKAPWKKW